MNHENYFNDLFESIPDCRKIVLLLFQIQNDKDLLHEIGFSQRHINRLNLECKNFLIEQHEKYLDYIKDEQESIFEKTSNK